MVFCLLQVTILLDDLNDNSPRFDISEYVDGNIWREDVIEGTKITTGDCHSTVLSH